MNAIFDLNENPGDSNENRVHLNESPSDLNETSGHLNENIVHSNETHFHTKKDQPNRLVFHLLGDVLLSQDLHRMC
ncbi:hypothetical protein [Bacillus sp. CECT 9360]|uniref:hypothetical protein n=1 Tax=Bacillus sp. CECT 9360 TaxID=2845821 RepID=UPI001E428884|nr:hypothetical protein [Bacillus sp. CECT 9360]CAH0347758.1 hypothetical protein BCI9360_04187 [Bacillus sp. CECT 9360]